MRTRYLLTAAARRIGVLAFGAAFLWQVAGRSGPPGCVAVVHVTEAGVDVSVDDWECRVECRRYAPIVRALRPGRHTLRMSRGGRVLYEENLIVRAGDR